ESSLPTSSCPSGGGSSRGGSPTSVGSCCHASRSVVATAESFTGASASSGGLSASISSASWLKRSRKTSGSSSGGSSTGLPVDCLDEPLRLGLAHLTPGLQVLDEALHARLLEVELGELDDGFSDLDRHCPPPWRRRALSATIRCIASCTSPTGPRLNASSEIP